MHNLENLRATMAQKGLSGLLVSELPSITWLTGFTGTAAKVLVTPTDALFITDSRYTVQSQTQVTNMPTVSFSTPVDGDVFLAEKARELGITDLGFEKASLTYAAYERLNGLLAPAKLVPTGPIFASLRMLKTPSEIEKIKEACLFADRTFEFLLDRVQVGRTEFDVHLDLEFYIRRHGHELAFTPIVVSGLNGAKPHGHATDKVLEDGDFVTMDFGAQIDGYNSDLTRTVVVGTASQRQREVYHQLLKAQIAALESIKPGGKARDTDALSRKVLDEMDLSKYFGHGLGHGLGRLVHDSGRMSGSSDDVYEVGQVWTVEPGVYIEGFGGLRIEDDVLVVEDGIEILTHAPKELLELPRR